MIGFAIDGFNVNITSTYVQGIGPASNRDLLTLFGQFF